MRFSVETMNHVMPFGKHKDMTVKWIIDNDPSYVLWGEANNVFDVDVFISDACRDATEDESSAWGELDADINGYE